MTRFRKTPLRLAACLVTLFAVTALVLPAPALAEVVAKKADAALVQVDTLPASPLATTGVPLAELRGEGLGAAVELGLLVAGCVLLALVIVYAID